MNLNLPKNSRVVSCLGQWWLCALLVLVLSARNLEAQDQNGAAPQTNDVSETQDLGMGDDNALGDVTQPDEMSQTNGVAPTNDSAAPEPDGRSRRLYRQRNRSRGDSQSNGYGNSAPSGTNNGPASLDYPAFRMVAEKNIFDPNRRARSGFPPPAKTTDSFTLVGTMSYEKGAFAFFDGTRSDYRKAVKPEEVIAGYKVVEVTPDAVKLSHGTNVVQLSVGTQMRQRDDGSWQQAAGSAAYAATSTPQPSSPSTDAPSSSNGADNDVLKKLMQRRERE
jgi:hypothetical protein